ncbi:type II toxin-antitoxin system VapC family toxin [Neorhizobium sp. JUb45]|uniref:PIN domain-containing protein n=1 Tax=unclassified Neorhizobium TaxID=2629175 RepID=UPI0010466899|nr:type II toxin-antitoxin system VapC family toxin [Neorhizobium sp. JUb45]TCR06634.1 putative nucleic-acid-binding protein [Neorhizobium sp. JUb45]
MIGLDTNMLARYFLDDDPLWSPRIARFFAENLSERRQGYINPITLTELVWVLRRRPEYDRAALAGVIEGILSSTSLVVGEAIKRALASFKAGSAGFADYLIAELNEAAGASPTVTLDRQAAKKTPFIPFSQEA